MSLVQELSWMLNAPIQHQPLEPVSERVIEIVNMMEKGKQYINRDFVEMFNGKYTRTQINDSLNTAMKKGLIEEIEPKIKKYRTQAKVYKKI